MTDTANLALPCIEGSQAQKHVTHNDALRILDTLVQLAVLDRDLTAPPGSPTDGQRWIVKATGTGDWAGHDDAVAAWQDGAWQFSAPQTGWLAYVVDEGALLAWSGSAWVDAIAAITSLNNMTLLGVGTTADSTNPFCAKLNNTLWTAKTAAEGGDGDLRWKMSKEGESNTLSMLFQDAYSGRAEIGLTGDDDFHFKVSPDGTTWLEAITIDKSSGSVTFPHAVVSSTADSLLVNGGMNVSQENGTSSVTLAAGGSTQTKYLLDQWMAVYRGSFVANAQQVTDAPDGYDHSLKLTVSTAEASLGADDELTVVQPVEGYSVRKLAIGTGSAVPLSIAFWVKAHRTGTYSGAVKNTNVGGGSPRSYPFTFTMNSADTWEYKTATITQLDTGSTWGAGSAAGLYLAVTVAAGSSRVGTADVWAGSDVSGASGTTNGVAATSDSFQLTGVVVLPGIALPTSDRAPRVMRPYPQELWECQRYFYKLDNAAAAYRSITALTAISATTQDGPFAFFWRSMRIAPSFGASGIGTFFADPGGVYSAGTISLIDSDTVGGTLRLDGTTPTFTVGNSIKLRFNEATSGYLTFDARM